MMALWRVWQGLWLRVCRITLTQRGNWRLATFFGEADYGVYVELMLTQKPPGRKPKTKTKEV